jgi:tetratricopeptide (TPR) repeat protein
LSAVLVLAAAAASVPLSIALEARTPARQGWAGSAPVLPRAGILRPLLLGFHPLAADLYWVRTIQYFGEHVQTDEQYPHLYPLTDLVTSLDPHFVEAYQIGGLFLVIGKRFPEAIALYEKGIKANPGRWELPHDLGRLYFIELNDDVQALRWWEAANRLPGRPHYLPRFIARLYTQTGRLETAFELWKSMYESSDNEWVRKTARKEMERIAVQLRTQAPQGRSTSESGR